MVGCGRGYSQLFWVLMSHPRQTQPSPQALDPKCTNLEQVLKDAVLPDADSSPSPNSSMTTRELQEYWRNEKCCWKPVKLLFEVASARIEEGKASKFVVSRDQEMTTHLALPPSGPWASSVGPQLSQP